MTKRNNKHPPPPKRQRIEAENDQNAEIDPSDSTIGRVYNACQEVLEKQKNIEKSMTEIVEKLRLTDEKLESIQLQLKSDKIDEATSISSNSLDSEAPVKATSSSDSSQEMIPREIMSTTGKYFVLKHIFKNVSKLKENQNLCSEVDEHFGIEWSMFVRREKDYLTFHMHCLQSTDTGKWTIEVKHRNVLVSNRIEKVREGNSAFANIGKRCNTSRWPKFIEWAVLEKDYLVDDKLTAEIHVKIEKTTGIYKDNLRNFDATMKEFSDVVLVVNEQKFYALKLYLAAHSPYFKALFLGNFNDSKKSEIKLTGIDADDFQNYLEVLYGEQPIDEYTCEGLLLVADMLDTPMVIRKCEQFLLKESKKTLKKKLELSTRYNLETLKKKCLVEIISIGDLQAVLPGNVQDLDKSIMGELLEKSISLHN
ncbi:hypothetical protein GCK72_006849 [Caenorhabditis remanei]|uniref:BTB domain-containing protein n=1 Tax=Caenorhabditis remanei TaxID=31234 RepID=A0A6A5HIE1_CAERE|nr:hypothetical protein GCK72_006849 [Caenorhabditis remanei]KAF1766891.1 hypothetical protein GCK72_006849 [Caenorhabditis remanei]